MYPKKNRTIKLPEETQEYLKQIDEPGAILALFDEEKMFYAYEGPLEAIIRYCLTESKHITLRVGGYSYRMERQALYLSYVLQTVPTRLESIYCGYHRPCIDYKDARAVFRELCKYDFDYEDPFVKYAEEYDYKCVTLRGVPHTMVYYYVNNIDPGWYDKEGNFHRFYDKHRGLEALGNVTMVRGYGDIKPATAALYSDSGGGCGDEIYCGLAAHYDKRSRTSSQRKLFEDAGIPFLNYGKDLYGDYIV